MHSMLPLCQLILLILVTQACCLRPAPAMGESSLAGFETATWQSSSRFGPAKTSFGVSSTSKPNSPSSPSTQQAAGDVWIGIWDTVTSDGIVTTLRFFKQGDQIIGRTTNVDRGSIFRFRGTPNPPSNEMTFILTQPATGFTRTGQIKLTSMDTFVGIFTEVDSGSKKLTWSGTRRQ